MRPTLLVLPEQEGAALARWRATAPEIMDYTAIMVLPEFISEGPIDDDEAMMQLAADFPGAVRGEVETEIFDADYPAQHVSDAYMACPRLGVAFRFSL